ncbi:MAG: histidinol dehydrogenase, partial [Anaerolineales bacterium]|nr:histidinol dehydrogenase [Anaerolineales bacterium]
MINIYSVDEAEKTILRRDMALEPTVPPRLQASLDRLFGEGSTPETAVSHLLKQIRQRGDAALRHWTAQIDGVDLGAIRLEPAAIAAAAERVEPELL